MTGYKSSTELFREMLEKSGVWYTAGYTVGDKRVSEDIATNVPCPDGSMLSFEEGEGGKITLFDLTPMQAYKTAMFLS